MSTLIVKYPALQFIAPFATFILMLAVKGSLPLDSRWEYPLRVLLVCVVLFLVGGASLPDRSVRLASSLIVGLMVFVIWVAPDQIWPGYRSSWLFHNALTGSATSSLSVETQSSFGFIVFRLIGTAIVVPIIEELFWRGWLMRYLVNAEFQKVPLGTYSRVSFWFTALLFASEHGPYWDVGLAAGLVYNWWMLRTRSLADCMIAHAFTNLCLAAFVVFGGQWQYWL